jgi:hypothetical protein
MGSRNTTVFCFPVETFKVHFRRLI